MAELTLLDPWLQLDRVSSRALLEASEERPDSSWVDFTDHWPSRPKRSHRTNKRAPSPKPILLPSRPGPKLQALKPTPSLEEAIQCYGLQVPSLPFISPARHRSHQTSEDRLLISPPVLHLVRLQPSTRTPGRPRLQQAFVPPPVVRIRRRSVLRASNSMSYKSRNGEGELGAVVGRKMKGSPGRWMGI